MLCETENYHREPRSLYWREQTCFVNMKTVLSKQAEMVGAVQPGEGKGFRETSLWPPRNLTPAQGREWPVANKIHNYVHLSQKGKKKKKLTLTSVKAIKFTGFPLIPQGSPRVPSKRAESKSPWVYTHQALSQYNQMICRPVLGYYRESPRLKEQQYTGV